MQRVEFGKYIVADPNICHGALTFKGTRIFVRDVIEMVADGMDWDGIRAEWDGIINYEAITSAVRLASRGAEERRYRGAEEKPDITHQSPITSLPLTSNHATRITHHEKEGVK